LGHPTPIGLSASIRPAASDSYAVRSVKLTKSGPQHRAGAQKLHHSGDNITGSRRSCRANRNADHIDNDGSRVIADGQAMTKFSE
jgi:hypothetical protein